MIQRRLVRSHVRTVDLLSKYWAHKKTKKKHEQKRWKTVRSNS